MRNIKEKLFKFICSFLCLFMLSACNQINNISYFNRSSNENIVNIAILLPLSGEEKDKIEEYAKMVKIGLADGTKTKIRVTTYDSSTEDKMNISLEKIFDTGTDIVIGSLYSGSSKFISQKIKGKNTIVISLSNNPSLADKNMYVFGHAPIKQLEQVTNYFLDHNYQNIIALLPVGRHSTITAKILEDIIKSQGGDLVKVEFYETNPQAIANSVRMVSDNVDRLNESDLNLTQPVILLSDDTETLSDLYKYTRALNLDKKAVIAGDSRLDLKSPVDIIFTGSTQIMNNNLINRVNKLGIEHISFIHAIAYDAGKMVGSYIGSNYNRSYFLEQLNSQIPFSGISGYIYFDDNIAHRKYDIIQKENGRYLPLMNNDKPNL